MVIGGSLEIRSPQARKCIETLDKRRFDRALLGSGDAFRHIVSFVAAVVAS